MKVLVDADACPRSVMKIILDFKEVYKYRLITVASFNHNIDSEEHIIVGNESQAADIALINKTSKNDIVVTADWGLASLALGKRARPLSPSGYIYQKKRIDFLLEERHLKAKIRRSGKRIKGPSKRTEEDDERFLKAFKLLLENKK